MTFDAHTLKEFKADLVVKLTLRLREASGGNGLEIDLRDQHLTNREQEIAQFVDSDAAQSPLPGLPRSVAATQAW